MADDAEMVTDDAEMVADEDEALAIMKKDRSIKAATVTSSISSLICSQEDVVRLVTLVTKLSR